MMARLDGEDTEISAERAVLHLAECENCQKEFEQMQITDNLLKRQTRREQDADLWSAIEPRIKAKTQTNWQPFVFLGIFLVAYKLLEMLPEDEFGLWFKLVPLVFVIALFGFLKENPFKINTELMLEK
jgi:hypothetical protein